MSEREPMLTGRVLDPLRFDESGRAPLTAKRRVFARVHHTLATAPWLAHEPENGSPRPIDGLASAPRISRFLQRLERPRAWIVAAAFAVGGASGATIHAAFEQAPAARIVFVDRWIAPPVSLAPTETPTLVPPAPVPAPAPNASSKTIHVPRARSIASVSPADELSVERGLLDGARKALGADDIARAEDILRAHERRFSAGVLAEEREALTIKVLAATGRANEARGKGALFRERYPQSLFGPAVDEALGSIP